MGLSAETRALAEALVECRAVAAGALDLLDPEGLHAGGARPLQVASAAAQLFASATLGARLLRDADARGGWRAMADRLGGSGLVVELLERVADAASCLVEAERLGRAAADVPVDAGKRSLAGAYEAWLADHDPALRRSRGVYYTPSAVARFVVARVDRVLSDELGLALGLAAPRDESGAALDILDPAAGTGAFLAEVVRAVHRRVEDDARARGAAPDAAWRAHVREALLPRLRGIEILPVAHALCHLRLVLALDETGYRLAGDERFGVHLADTLDERAALVGADSLTDLLAAERIAAHRLLAGRSVGVVLTNPPYRRGARRSDVALDAYKRDLEGERNLQPLADDHVRFIRRIETLLTARPTGVWGLVGNATMLSGPLYRGLRRSLVESFDRVDVVDLHGSTKVRRRAPGAPRDENVFDVGQGIAVAILRRLGRAARGEVEASYAELWGSRVDKERRLVEGTLEAPVALSPRAPLYALVPHEEVALEYATFVPLDALFSFHSVGGKPGDDAALVGFDAADVLARLDAARARVAQQAPDDRSEAGGKLARRPPHEPFDPARVVPYAYRPFDVRRVYDDPSLWTRPVAALRAHVDGAPLLLASRVVNDFDFAHIFVARAFPDVIALSASSSGNCHVFPSSCLRLEVARERFEADASARAAFAYLYAVLHSPTYRTRYGPALRLGYPRVPGPRSRTLFDALARLGEALLALHLLEAPLDEAALPRFVDGGDRRLTRARGGSWVDARGAAPRLAVNASSWFEPVPRAVWEHRVGGHLVLRRWLAERKRAGRPLSDADVAHLRRVIASVERSLRVVSEIDSTVEHHGGWPTAFRG